MTWPSSGDVFVRTGLGSFEVGKIKPFYSF